MLVPHNRWDLLPPDDPLPDVAVVVTHYRQPGTLPLVLAALREQTHRPYEVVVADDGSPEPPVVPDGVQVVRQQDLGFRAAAARNLGAAATTAPVLAFLDGDTVPEPGYLARLVQRAAHRDVLAVGRRRHADLTGDGRELPAPSWLANGYARHRDLLDADGLSFRFVISAAMACSRALFDDLGGFDERFTGYGGEDWDLAYRAWNAGAVLVHEAAAVCTHDGPDWAGRPSERDAKDRETERLAALIPHPQVRGAPLPQALPDVLVDLPRYDPRALTALLRQSHRDLAVRAVRSGELHACVVREEPWTADQRARARAHLELGRSALLPPDAVERALAMLVDGDLGEVRLQDRERTVGVLRSTRAAGRSRRWGRDVTEDAFGRADLEVQSVRPRDDLAGFLAAPWS